MHRSSFLAAALVLAASALPLRAADLTTDNLRVYGQLDVGSWTPTPTPTNGLMMHFSFDQNDGGITTDSSGNHYTGVVHGATWTNTGVAGGAYSFDGTNDTIEIDTTNKTSQGAVSLWVYVRDFHGNSPNIFSGNRDAFDSEFYLELVLQSSGGVTFYGQNPQNQFNSASTNATPRQWHHVVWMSDGSNHTAYVDGTIVGPFTGIGAMRWFGAISSLDQYVIGALTRSTQIYWPLNGLIDEVRMYNRPLTADEVRSLYHNIVPPSPDAGTAIFHSGIKFIAPLGDIPMGTYTNR